MHMGIVIYLKILTQKFIRTVNVKVICWQIKNKVALTHAHPTTETIFNCIHSTVLLQYAWQ